MRNLQPENRAEIISGTIKQTPLRKNLLNQFVNNSRIKLVAALGLITSGVFGCVGETGPQGPRGLGTQGEPGEQGEPGTPGSGENCAAPTTSMEMINSFNIARLNLQSCQNYYDNIDQECSSLATPELVQGCYDGVDSALNNCNYDFAVSMNYVPYWTCGAKIFKVEEADQYDPESYQLAPESLTADTDGDGIIDQLEPHLGLNLCEEFSNGSCQPADGQLDADHDGKPNASDEDILCNPDAPYYLGKICP